MLDPNGDPVGEARPKIPIWFLVVGSVFLQVSFGVVYYGGYQCAIANVKKRDEDEFAPVATEKAYQMFRSATRRCYAAVVPVTASICASLLAWMPLSAGPDWEGGDLLKNSEYLVLAGASSKVSFGREGKARGRRAKREPTLFARELELTNRDAAHTRLPLAVLLRTRVGAVMMSLTVTLFVGLRYRWVA